MITLGDECKRYANNFYIFESNLEIQRKTMVIRYEDLALNPMKYSRKVYKFLGVQFTDSIEQMMKDAIEPPKKEIKDKGISENNKVGRVFLMIVVSMLPQAKIGRNDHRENAPHFSKPNSKMCLGTATYTTNRAVNKTVVYNTWRLDNLLSLSEIEEIENLCGEMMGLYGYFKVGDNLENYKNFQTDFVDSESQFNLL